MTKIIKTSLLLLAAISVVACGGKDDKAQPEAVYESERGEVAEMTMSEKIKLGEDIFKGKGNCASCHQTDKKIIGPSVKEILQVYDKHNADLVSFLRGNEEPIVDPSQFIIMQANLEITKKFSNLEMEALIAYMRSL